MMPTPLSQIGQRVLRYPSVVVRLQKSLTKAKPLHTESSLLGSMETCGKDMVDEELRAKLKECGIGTPATRASIIETLFSREYMGTQ